MTARCYSTEFADHEGLIHSFARKGFGRLQAARVSIDYDDVFQEMCLSFTKAREKYNPDAGFSFSAYFGRAIWNDFNKFAERLISERVDLGLINFEDMKGEDDDGGDITEYLMLDVQFHETPESRLEDSQEFIQRFGKIMRQLSPVTRKVVVQFVAPSEQMKAHFIARKSQYEWGEQMGVSQRRMPDHISLDFVIREMVSDPQERTMVRAEIKRLLQSMEQ
ncbi:sigma-70 family RNA polymerase sigma factor [Methyloversatilis sp.]|uniref:sigma-70 family RNA polymerase sigma factor n=1 Tax=Methyloversatilis sp. TaxID=2569862 RepID=UPI0035B15F59